MLSWCCYRCTPREDTIYEKNTALTHKLGVFGEGEEEIEIPKKLTYVEDEEENFEYEEYSEADYDENSPFI